MDFVGEDDEGVDDDDDEGEGCDNCWFVMFLFLLLLC